MSDNSWNYIDDTVQMGANISLGIHNVVEESVTIGNNVTIGHKTIIKKHTVIGNNVTVQDGAILGKEAFFTGSAGSSLTSDKDQLSPLVIADNVLIATTAICYSGTRIQKDVIVADNAIIREGCLIGEGSRIGKNVIIEWGVQLGKNVRIQAFSLIGEKMTVGDRVFIGPHVSTACDKTMYREKMVIDPPIIEHDVCIGENSTIFPGVKIGCCAVIGAGTLIAKDIPSSVIVVAQEGRIISKIVRKKK